MAVQKIQIFSPVKGVFIDLVNVPDPVFAEKMVGDGFAIDPLDNVLCAPIEGVIKSVHRAKHAITLESDMGFDVLIHLGLETVSLAGKGFDVKVKEGQRVKVGDKLSEFNLDYVADNVVALITPVLITDIEEKNIKLTLLPHGKIIELASPVLQVEIDIEERPTLAVNTDMITVKSELITVLNPHGIHARPAAQLNLIARNYPHNEIMVIKGEQLGNVKSIVSLLGLSIQYQDQIRFLVKGADGQQIIDALHTQMLTMQDEDKEEQPNLPENCSKNNIKVEEGKYYGVVASAGLAVAKLVKQGGVVFSYERHIADIGEELTRLNLAIDTLIRTLNEEILSLNEFEVAHKNILNAHKMLLTDPEIIQQAKKFIALGQSAPYAWEQVTEEACANLRATGNTLLIERQSDLVDVRDRLLTFLCGENSKFITEYKEDVILVAEDFTPSQVIAFNSCVKGLVSVRGGVTSHAAILARARGIPFLVGVAKEVLQEESKLVILDTNNSALLNILAKEIDFNRAHAEILNNLENLDLAKNSAKLPAITIDELEINCFANIGSIQEAKLAINNGADGIGLFRTEFMFLESATAPNEDIQLQEYLAINQLINNKNFVIRTLDIGGDKKLPYLFQAHEVNPMLGVRGIRLGLAYPELLKTQLRAILRTNVNNIKIMIPMISKLCEYRAVKQILEEIKAEQNLIVAIQLGIMVEVPSTVFLSEAFAREVDFMSIGTNDLTQYIMAIDREHTSLAHEVDHFHPSVLMAIAQTAINANKYNTDLSVCGLMASERLAIPLLIGLGIRNLSMTVATIPENKAFIRRLSYANCKEAAEHCLGLTAAFEVREYLKNQFN